MKRPTTVRLAAGKTLIEMAVIIAITSVVLSLVTTTLATLFRIERQLTGDIQQDAAVTRLASQFRADAHAAIEVKMDQGCVLLMVDGRQIVYALAAPAVKREVRRGDEVVHQDAFVLPPRATVQFSAVSDRNDELQIKVARPSEPGRFGAIPVREVLILASVNLHHQPAPREDVP